MNKIETVAGLIVLIIGIVLCVEANKLAYMVESVPGPGFLPLWVSFGILGTGGVLTFNALRGRVVDDEPIVWPNISGWRQVGVLLAALAAALLLLEPLGFLITTTGFMAIVVFSLGVRHWGTLVLAPVAAAGILYLVFAVWLNVPLPTGLLDFNG